MHNTWNAPGLFGSTHCGSLPKNLNARQHEQSGGTLLNACRRNCKHTKDMMVPMTAASRTAITAG